jgi:long-subunit fatty acid transport protein
MWIFARYIVNNGRDTIWRTGWFLILCLVQTGVVNADQYHYNNILIGDRASGLGGAYTAIADDPSGLYYNPSGTVYATGSSISGSMNAFHYTVSEYKNVLGGDSWTRESSTLTPNFFGVVQPLFGGMAGFSYAVNDAMIEDQDQVFEGFFIDDQTKVSQYIINFNNQDTTYNIGPSFAKKITDNLSWGITLYGYYRKKELILNQQVYLDEGGSTWTNQYFETTEIGINPVLGLTWSPIDKLSLGLSVKQPKILSVSTRRQDTVDARSPDPSQNNTEIASPTIIESDYKRDLPLNVNAGIAYFANDKLLFSGDVNYFSAVESLEPVVNFAGGIEYYFNSKWALRAGGYTNFANTPTLTDTQENQLEHVDLYGVSTSLSHFTRNSAISAGVSYSRGAGHAQVIDQSSAVQELVMQTLTVFLSAVYAY